ncbi:hypothetical protein SISNIDRAFT_490073 [Sistotremastrum niveocremeum HHB9708]|uniref:NACHT domain-containing protein n=1 Tax=Sistotremastrum niveocremeum HHB9708 TaxID=1314777 RepID=A0A164P8F8_9AGAM|nr:hypothetical protein SISNIDRAFT_490073 [Sistotremastrum niveocremeum HHB9708]
MEGGSSPAWTETISIDSLSKSLTVKIYIKHAMGSDVFFGTLTAEIAELSSELRASNAGNGDQGWTKPRRVATGGDDLDDSMPNLSFRFTPFDQAEEGDNDSATISAHSEAPSSRLDTDLEQLRKAKEAASQAIKSLKKVPLGMQREDDLVETAKSAGDILGPVASDAQEIFGQIGAFVDVVDKIAEVHPYAKLAWAVISLPFKITKAQMDRDEELTQLVDAINDTYAFIATFWRGIDDLAASQDSLKKMTVKLIVDTVTCGAFICDECSQNAALVKRTIRHILTGPVIDARIAQFKSDFKDRKTEIAQLLTGHNFVGILDLEHQMSQFSSDDVLKDLPYLRDAGYGEGGCLPGTRKEIIDEICSWIKLPIAAEQSGDRQSELANRSNTDTGASVFWLRGHAGSGKSALATTIARHFDTGNERCLGSSFFFDKAIPRRARDVLWKISRDLAGLNPLFRKALVGILTAQPDLKETSSIPRQFEKLILEPARMADFSGSILIVIDALDECDDVRDRHDFLSIIFPDPTDTNTLNTLPSNFRVLLTSRPENYLEKAAHRNSDIRRIDLSEVSLDLVERDLVSFYEHQFARWQDLLQTFNELSPNKDCIRLLTERSERLFQWAFTACRFLLKDEPPEILGEQYLAVVKTSGLTVLDDLYTKILSQVVGTQEAYKLHHFRSVMGRVLCVQKPLCMSEIKDLRLPDEHHTYTAFFLQRMGSVLSGISTDTPVQTFHTSFRDFLFAEERSSIYYVRPVEHDGALAEACLRVLNDSLEFNICKLTSSYITYTPQLVEKAVGYMRNRGYGHVTYASIYWASHLRKSAYTDELSSLLHTFAEKQFLHWLEVLGSIGEIYVAIGAIRSMTEWATVCNISVVCGVPALSYVQGHDDKLAEFGTDAGKFVSNFAEVIARSPPHLYISALPFAPESSVISQRYLPQFSGTLDVKTGKQQIWSPVDLVFGDRGDYWTKEVLSIAYSPDGTILIAVTDNELVWLWNPSTGQSVASFSETEASPACVVEISPDGRYFAVGSQRGDIVLRDFKTQALIWGPKGVGTQKIVCLRFSLNSGTLWAGDEWAYLGAWDVRTGDDRSPVEELHGDDGTCTVISIDATRLACAPGNWSLVLFHRDGGDTTWSNRREITTVTDAVFALTFSPDGQRLVSGHDSGAIKIWNVDSGDLLGVHSTAHTNQIYSLAFSSDGLFFASSSFDRTIQLWDGTTGDPIGNALSGFGEVHRKVAISADGKSVTTVIVDGGIYVWDAEGMKQSALLDAKSVIRGPYPSVIALSPDGKHLYAARSDHSICEYDTETGAEIGTVMRGHRKRIWHLSVSSDGTNLVSCSSDTTISIWNIEARKETHEPLTGHSNEVVFTAFNPDRSRLLSCSTDKTLRIWDTATWETIGEPLTGHTGIVTCAVFFDTGQRIISGSLDGTIRIWDAENRNQVGESVELHTGGVSAMALSPTDDLIASADTAGVIHLWYPATLTSSLRHHHTLQHGTDEVNSVSFSADGARLLSASVDHTICLWDVSIGELIGRPFEGHSGPVMRAYFSDNERMISSSHDGSIRIWGINDVAEAPESEEEVNSAEDELQRSFPRIQHDGWVRSEDDPPKLLCWLPLHYRPIFQWSRCRKIIGQEALYIDFSRFEHGERWTNCRSSR